MNYIKPIFLLAVIAVATFTGCQGMDPELQIARNEQAEYIVKVCQEHIRVQDAVLIVSDRYRSNDERAYTAVIYATMRTHYKYSLRGYTMSQAEIVAYARELLDKDILRN